MVKYIIPYFIFSLVTTNIDAQVLVPAPFFQISQMEYQGAFRLPTGTFGISSLSYSEGPIAYNPDNHSLFVVGHTYEQAIAEFSIPLLSTDNNISNLNMADAPLQSFANTIFRPEVINPEELNRIGGICYYPDSPPKLIINAYEYYDAPADNSTSTIIIENALSLATSDVKGAFQLIGDAAHLSGWIAQVPEPYDNMLGSSHLFGHSSGIPIIGRASVGPSAFFANFDNFSNPNYSIAIAEPLLDFSLNNPLHEDLSNDSLENQIWTHLSRAVYGFIVPDTRTYFTLGCSGGHHSGVCYKCTQSDSTVCGGYCTPDADDNYNYYWLWNMDELMDVYNGNKAAHEIRPYDYGALNTKFGNGYAPIIGASFDPESSQLYISIGYADTLQGEYSYPPLIEVYQLPQSITTNILSDESGIEIYPNPTNNWLTIQGELDNYSIKITNASGTEYLQKNLSGIQETLNLESFPDELLFLQLIHDSNMAISVQKIIKMN